MNTFKRWTVCLCLVFSVICCCHSEEWLVDYDVALQKARAENKAVVLDFTGSDWCPWCMKLKSEVFDQPEFGSYADGHLILVEVDFPRRWVLNAAQQEANNELARKYRISGYPTVVVLDSSGKQIGTTGYHPGGPKTFIESIERMPGFKHSNNATDRSTSASPPARQPQFVPVPPAKPMYYDQLALKGISGGPNRRMALVNNETLMVGETAKVKFKDSKIEVTCKEIRADSVSLLVDGKPVELKLAHP